MKNVPNLHIWEIGDGYTESLMGEYKHDRDMTEVLKRYVRKVEREAKKLEDKVCFWLPLKSGEDGRNKGLFGSGKRIEFISEILESVAEESGGQQFFICCCPETWSKIISLQDLERSAIGKIH